MRDDIQDLVGVPATVHLARFMPHNPPVLAALHPEGAASMGAVAKFVRAQLDATG